MHNAVQVLLVCGLCGFILVQFGNDISVLCSLIRNIMTVALMHHSWIEISLIFSWLVNCVAWWSNGSRKVTAKTDLCGLHPI